MKKLSYLFVTIAVMAMTLSCNKEAENAEAQVQNPEEKTTLDQPQPAEMQVMRIGRELALYGYENESPEALIEAANILASIETQPLQAQVTRGREMTEETATQAHSFAPADLLAAAREMAGDDQTLLAMIKKVEDKIAAAEEAKRDGTRGNVSGVMKTTEESVQANDYDEYRLEFKANEMAVCQVVGSTNTDIDLYILDEDGNIVVDDTDYTSSCYCSWTPKTTAIYTIRIVNRGDVANDYTIMVN